MIIFSLFDKVLIGIVVMSLLIFFISLISIQGWNDISTSECDNVYFFLGNTALLIGATSAVILMSKDVVNWIYRKIINNNK